ncbi:uncharacterized protein LOC143033576 [Oratosquilla oratoria]|uniref:uncharacterized protein LOC143033576 n=1 Tax=Oratosquilla oratoria TaxID=337810 RepID=UPI003F76066B
MISSWLEDFGSGEGFFEEAEGGGEGVGVVARRQEDFSSDLLNKFFEVGPVLGSGSFGWVYRAVARSTGEPVAIKCQLEEVCAEAVDKEIEAFRNIGNHPNVISMHEVIRDHENEHIYFVLDLMELSLEDTVTRMATQGLCFSESELKSLWLQCLTGLRHIHRVGFLHCDMAARNILLDRTGAVKISDFGLAVRREESEFRTRKDDLFDLGVVFVFSVSHENVGDLDLLAGKVSSAGMQLVEQMLDGDISLRKALKSRYFCEEPIPRRPQIGHILSDNSSDQEESIDTSSDY